MKSGGSQPRSTAVWGGIPSAIPTVPGWTTPRRRWGAAETDAAWPDLDHDERVRKRLDDGRARGQQQGGQDGTEERITMQRNTQTHPENPSAFGEALLFGVIWGWPFG